LTSGLTIDYRAGMSPGTEGAAASLGADGAFVAVRRSSVVTDAVEQVKSLIAAGTLQPGQQLPAERTLSELLGLSRPAVREAVNALAAIGLLDKRHGSGTYVTDLSAEVLAQPLAFLLDKNHKALHDLFEVRFALESQAASAAAVRCDDSLIAALDDVRDQLEASFDDVRAFVAADMAFHRLIHEASGNVVLLSLMASLTAMGKSSRMLTARDPAVRRSTIGEHDTILEALRARDPEQASSAMRTHLRHVLDHLPA
jgi:GntR family transcriptional repressor for pyruvate dehydrogenase complex